MLLENKTAIVYGAGGAVGQAVSRAFAREGAWVFLTGRRSAGLGELAAEIRAGGGRAEVAQVDALNRDAVDRHAAEVVEMAGGIDISVNAVSIRGDLQGTPLVELSLEDFLTPVKTAATANFLTATAAARHMAGRGSGVILMFSTAASRLSGRDQGFHATGGFGVACGAVELLSRHLAGEVGPSGVRVVCLRPDGIPDAWVTWGMIEDAAPDPEGSATVKAYMERGTALRRLPRLAEVADTAAFMASDRAGAVTGTVVNLSCGSVID
ncbi:3-oxoacyl-ACP reductase [Kitasatospora herbaricolor]|uniref:SDR family NAD(P)-dependent oxidoreductase n=1 Tax=Kitasatospora herbaricolor TaxID=68217 RepID=UPI0017487A41|nr:SDR family oxidoreductase [Kitasatospora herbaricolor]MDQ0308108.1 NAD(P)-dependent dehydrogenase (short-subunit alcohol dehydrogenase family) [Kitasatospora herbaricolor]GGV05425.1 3-oxoacyl-ACP reductase [Kitasatospora herbaricolor]